VNRKDGQGSHALQEGGKSRRLRMDAREVGGGRCGGEGGEGGGGVTFLLRPRRRN